MNEEEEKVEEQQEEGLTHFDEILQEADGIILSRGNLGIDLPPEKNMQRCSQPIPCSTFNNDGSIYAYAVCYDWSNYCKDGGSWSTTFSPKSTAKLVNDSNLHSGENETGLVSNPQELHGKLSATGSSSRAVGPVDRVSTPAGAHQGSIFAKDTRNLAVQAADPSSEDKRTQ